MEFLNFLSHTQHHMYKLLKTTVLLLSFTHLSTVNSQTDVNKFAQLETLLPTPNNYRTASGAPGKDYWQQKVDYNIKVEIDDVQQKLYGFETITYYNNSPDVLEYLWLQLDQNIRESNSDGYTTSENTMEDKMSSSALKRMQPTFDGGFKIETITQKTNNLHFVINKTMMRVDLPTPLKPGENFIFDIKWWYNIPNSKSIGGRGGYEFFESDSNYVYCMAQFFPRLCKYYDVYGWQNKQFLGRGEFTLEFGDYDVEITVPSDHLIACTGTLTNFDQVLDASQKSRFLKAKNSFDQPVVIATKEEADERIKSKSTTKKTWKFKAINVRDCAFATSRRFIWDAMNTKLSNNKTTLSMSMYVKEGNCLWSKYSTKAVAHTLKTYSKYSIDYPYPCAWSIDGSMGMEYPMICFNFGRCEEDGTYDERMKYGHIGVIIHEVGHNFFPMIINSDERQWTWMDEGLNTFVQYLAEQEFERGYPSRRGEAQNIVEYMAGDKTKISPIMTNSESIFQFGNNAYAKPATALNILRETVMGRELFDYAFREYAKRWAFKTPTPADFFRTMEDASGVDLDWFWRGWFYTTNHVDQGIKSVKHYKLNPANPNEKYEIIAQQKKENPINISTIRNLKEIKETYNEKDTLLNDYYTQRDKDLPDREDLTNYEKLYSKLSTEEKELFEIDNNYYQITFENIGDLPMPILFKMKYKDGTSEEIRIPAEVWRMGNTTATKVITTTKEVEEIILDPFLETADVDRNNNYFPPRSIPNRFEIFKQKEERKNENPMQRHNRLKEIKP